MITVDARGLFCPAPVVEARRAIDRLPKEGGRVQIFVDNQMAAENLGRMAEAGGYGHTLQEQGEGIYNITITVGEGRAAPEVLPANPPLPRDGTGLVVAIGRDSMGGGSEELGEILIKGFLYTLLQLDPPPRALLLFNSGVKLALDDSNTLADIRALSERGTRLIVCGTCVNYYEVSHKLGAGEIGNMFDIVREMAEAAHVINL